MSEKNEEGCLGMAISLVMVAIMAAVIGWQAYYAAKDYDELKSRVKAMEEKSRQ